jgi:PiT family inorganic phosphate transporter
VGIVVGIGEIDINLLLFITGLSLASGIIILGRGVIQNLSDLTELHPSSAFAAEIPVAVILFVGTMYGIPLSGSHMIVASLLGLAKARKAPIKKGVWKISLIWIITFPMASFIAVILYGPISIFF